MCYHGNLVARCPIVAFANDTVYHGTNVILSDFFIRIVPIVKDLEWVIYIYCLVLKGVKTAASAGNPDIVALLGQLHR